MVICTCDACGYSAVMEKAHGGSGQTWKFPSMNWLTTKNGVACSSACYAILKSKPKDKKP